MRLHDRYLLGERIGAGAFGTSYAATDEHDGAPVVVKRLSVGELGDWKNLERFEREAGVLRTLNHRGVPRFIDAFEAEHEGKPAFFIVTEHVEGQTLQDKIDRGARWSTAETTAVFRRLLETLEYLHGLSPRVIHRDIKPGNVVVRPDGQPVLIDFGSVLDPSRDGLTVMGTPGYMPPEQAMGRAEPRSDLYALAATMLHVLTHRHPSELPHEGLRPTLRALSGIDDGLSAILQRLLEPEPERRFSSARAVLDALDDPTRAEPPATPPALVVRDGTALATRIPSAPRPLTPQVLAHLDIGHALQSLGPRRLVTMFGVTMAVVVLAAMARLTMFGLLFAIAMLPLTWSMLTRQRTLSRSLYRGGQATIGKIVELSRSDGTVSAAYTFDVDGKTYDGRVFTTDPRVVGEVHEATPIAVFFDAANPTANVAMLEPELRILH